MSTRSFASLAGLAAGLFISTALTFGLGAYALGAWLALGCIAISAWLVWKEDAVDPFVKRHILKHSADLEALAGAVAATDARVAATLSFLQATQTFQTARPTGPNGRPLSPLKNPLRTTP